MLLDPQHLRTLRQFSEEAPAFPVRYVRWLIDHADQNGFTSCFVRIAGRIFIDPVAVTAWLAHQQTQPLPHNRGISQKRIAEEKRRELAAVGGTTNASAGS